MRAMIFVALGCVALSSLATAATKGRPIGATLAEIVAIARATSPEVAAAALDAEAATARIVAAGALPDPVASIENENFSPTSTSGRGTSFRYRVMQEFPLWGKRQLKADIAGFDAEAADSRRKGAVLSLETRLKSVFAARYATYAARRLNQEIHDIVASSVKTADARFAQNATGFEEVTKLRIEAVDLDMEAIRLQGQVTKTAAQINALLSRRVDAPLAVPVAFRRLPPDRSMTLAALVNRATRLNLEIVESRAKASGAASARDLAEANRYPDVSVGSLFTTEDRRYGSAGVLAEVKIPLQWEAKSAEVRATSAEKAAAEARVDALKQRVSGDVAGLAADYRAARKSLIILRDHHLPEAQAALKSARGQVESAAGSLSDVYLSEQRLRRVRLDILKLETEQQITVAEIEKAIGGDL